MLLLNSFILSGFAYVSCKVFKIYQENTVTKLLPQNNKEINFPKKDLLSAKKTESSVSQHDLAETDIMDVEEWINRYFTISSIALLSTLGGIWIPFLTPVSVMILAYLTWPIARRSYQGLIKQKRLKADTLDLICLPILIFSGYLPAAAIGYWLYYLGLKFLAQAKHNSQRQLEKIFQEPFSKVWIRKADIDIEVDFSALQFGDIVIVQGGEPIPVDGVIVEGVASVDQRMMTGESQPVEKEVGDAVFAFTLMLSGKIYVQVEKAGAETQAAQTQALLTQTTNYAASRELKLEKIADDLTLPSFILAGLAIPVAGYTGALVVLDSPLLDHLYVSGNINILSHLSLASRYKLLIKDGRALERLREVDTVVFDKTGTLTQEQPHIGQIYPMPGFTEENILIYAATAEYKQKHPIAKAILDAAQARNLTLPIIDDIRYEIGYGIQVQLDSQVIRVGSARYMILEGIEIPSEIATLQQYCEEHAYSLIYIALDQHVIGTIELHPTLRPEAEEVIQQLKKRGLSLYIISGDHEKPTKALAQQLGIDNYFSGTLPQDKANLIAELQNQGKTVCFMGDGINDAVALKKADLSISLNSASTVATDTAQVILMDDDLRQFNRLFALSESLQKNLKRSVMWDVVPNTLCIGGALFLHMGIYGALALYCIGLAGGLVNGFLPSIKHKVGINNFPLTKNTILLQDSQL